MSNQWTPEVLTDHIGRANGAISALSDLVRLLEGIYLTYKTASSSGPPSLKDADEFRELPGEEKLAAGYSVKPSTQQEFEDAQEQLALQLLGPAQQSYGA